MSTSIAKLAFFAFLICFSVFAQPHPDGDVQEMIGLSEQVTAKVDEQMAEMGVTLDTCDAPGGPLDFALPSLIALIAVATGIAIFYMAGNFLGSPQILAMSKQEIYELIHTALIVALFFSFYSFAEGMMGIGSGGDGIFDKAMGYSLVMVQKISLDMFWLSLLNTLIYMFYDAPLKFGGQLYMAIHLNLGGVLKPFVDAIGTMASLMSFALAEWIVNLIILCFIKKHMLTLFLPLGIILKSFPQTRGGGNALIATSIALFLVYPLMIVMNSEAYVLKYGLVEARSGVESLFTSLFFPGGLWAGFFYGLFLKAMTKTMLGILFFSIATIGTIDLLMDIIYTVFVLSIFLPLLNVFVTFTFAKEIAKYFGTELNLAAFAKLI